jgi:hypothetical protein
MWLVLDGHHHNFKLSIQPLSTTLYKPSFWDSFFEPSQIQDSKILLEHCPLQDPNETCASLFSLNPDILRECQADPSLPECTLNCFDVPNPNHPEASFGVIPTLLENTTKDSQFWPPYGTGQWIQDMEYLPIRSQYHANMSFRQVLIPNR